MNQPDKVIRRSVTLYEREWKIVEAISEQYGLANFSAAVRLIINQHDQRQAPAPCQGDQHHDPQ